MRCGFCLDEVHQDKWGNVVTANGNSWCVASMDTMHHVARLTKDEARGEFVDGLAGLFSDAITAGITEEELRADFEACLSVQAFDDRPTPKLDETIKRHDIWVEEEN